MNIIEKIKSLTPKEVIMAMVEGLQNPKTKIKMSTYGYKDGNNICYGCAATNCLLTLDPTLELGTNTNGFNYLFPVEESLFIDISTPLHLISVSLFNSISLLFNC